MTYIIQGEMDAKELFIIIIVVAIIAAVVALVVFKHNKEAMQILKIVFLILMIIVILYILYEVYEYFKKIRNNEPLLIYGAHDATKQVSFKAKELPRSNIGAEYTYSFWLYINSYDYKYDHAKHVLSKGSYPSSNSYMPMSCNPGIWFYPKTSSLMIRFDTFGRKPTFEYYPGQELIGDQMDGPKAVYDDTTLKGCEEACIRQGSDCGGVIVNTRSGRCVLKTGSDVQPKLDMPCNTDKQCDGEAGRGDAGVGSHNFICDGGDQSQHNANKPPWGNCRSVYDSYLKTDSMDPNRGNLDHLDPNDQCDLVELPIQRWVHVSVVLWNRTTDIYLNGKLVRSCILPNVAKVPWDEPLYVCQEGGFNGSIATLRYFNRALNASEIYKLYRKGPLHWNILREFEDLFPKVTLSGSVSYDASKNHHSKHHQGHQ